MKKFLCFAGLALLMPHAAPAHDIGFDTEFVWEFACFWGNYDCTNIDRPRFVLYLPAGLTGVRGTYNAGVVYLSPSLAMGADVTSTAIHETVHYLQDVVDGSPNFVEFGDLPGMKRLCRDEELAFEVGDTFWRYAGVSDNQRGPRWWVAYPHCYRFYDPDYIEIENEQSILDLILKGS